MKHTPKPWNVGISLDHTYGRPWPVFRIELLEDPSPGSEEVQANRRLIEAAPDLLEACQRMCKVLGSGSCTAWQAPAPFWASYDLMKIAIAKATGEDAT